jgi:DNA polymerase III alpha subunit
MKYNRLVAPDKRIRLRSDFAPTLPTPAWAEEYMLKCTDDELHVYMCKMLQRRCAHMSIEYSRQAVERFSQEWELFSRKGMFLLLRVLIGIINTLTKNSVPWGPGRGSSTSSYILFLIGLHNVDSVLYDVDVTDFIR